MENSYKEYLEDVDSYLAPVKDRARKYIDQQIWDSISHTNLNNWLSNFKTPEERFLSALLLDQLSLRSNKQTSALLRHAICNCLPNALHDSVISVLAAPDYLKLLQSRADDAHKIKIVPVIRDQDPPTKSGPSVARLYKRNLKINEENMIWPWQMDDCYKNGTTTMIFIDDVVGSGQQFTEFINKNIPIERDGITFVYIPLLAHASGLKKIKTDLPYIKVMPVEIADDESNFFNKISVKNIVDLKDLYINVTKKHVNKRLYKKMMFGYENLSMTIGFSHATPNSTLPLYWFESDNFFPLIGR